MGVTAKNRHLHCVKSAHIRSFSGPYFPAFELNTERYGISLHIQYKCGKIRTRKTPNTHTFYTVLFLKVYLVNAKSASDKSKQIRRQLFLVDDKIIY